MADNKKSYANISGLTIKVCKLPKNKWIPKYGEKLTVQLAGVDESPSAGLDKGFGSIEVLRIDNVQTVGWIPTELWSYFHCYLTLGGHIMAEVTNTEFLASGNERELFCDYILQGPSNAAIKRIINDLGKALKGPEFEHYQPTLVTREDRYRSYFHHAVSKAPDLEAKCKAMSKYPKRIRRQRSLGHGDTNEDPQCSYHENSTLQRKGAKSSSLIVADHAPKHWTRKKSESKVTPTCSSLEKETKAEITADLLPEELDNDPWTRQIYQSALEQGQEVDFTMRLMIIGCFGQGKSSLAKRLMGQSAHDVESTNGIEVNICEISKDGSKWEQKKTEDAATECIKRLVSVSRSNSSASLKSLNTDELMDTNEPPNFPHDESNDLGDLMKINIDTDSCLDLNLDLNIKRKSFDLKETNKTRAEKEKVDMNSNKSKTNSAKKIDLANVKRFSSEYRKSISFEKESPKEDTKMLSIWDFGGQFVYYATHQLFHSRHAIYLLVFSLIESLDTLIEDDEKPSNVKPKTMREYIKFWISSVHSFVGNRQGTEPTIILVGTKKDLLDSDIDIEQKFEDIRKLFDGSKMLHHLSPDHFSVSNLQESSDQITKLCACINDLVQKQCQSNFIPARWIPLERKLKENRSLKIVDLKTVLKFNNENEVPIEDDDQIKVFLQYHHARGTFFYFANDDESQVVIDPQYIVDAFKCLLTAERFCIVRPSLRESWHKLRDKAILDRQLLHDVWGRDEKLNFLKFENILIFFLKKHRIIAEAIKFEENTNKGVHPESLGFFIVPSLLSKPDQGLLETFKKGKKCSQVSLIYVFEIESVVPTLFYRLAAAGCGRWPLIEFLNEMMIFENSVLFKVSPDHAGLIKLGHNTLEILVIGLCPPHKVDFNDCDLFRRFVEMVIGQELRKFRDDGSVHEGHGMYTKSMRCYHKIHGIIGSTNTFELEPLIQSNKKRTGCPDHVNHSIRTNKIFKEWYKAGLDIRCIPRRQLSRPDLSSISMLIGENWQHLGIHLGFHKAEIEQIDMTPNLTMSMKIFELLSRWDNREIENATLDVLVVAINKCKRVLKYDKDLLRNLIDELDSL